MTKIYAHVLPNYKSLSGPVYRIFDSRIDETYRALVHVGSKNCRIYRVLGFDMVGIQIASNPIHVSLQSFSKYRPTYLVPTMKVWTIPHMELGTHIQAESHLNLSINFLDVHHYQEQLGSVFGVVGDIAMYGDITRIEFGPPDFWTNLIPHLPKPNGIPYDAIQDAWEQCIHI